MYACAMPIFPYTEGPSMRARYGTVIKLKSCVENVIKYKKKVLLNRRFSCILIFPLALSFPFISFLASSAVLLVEPGLYAK